MSRIKISNVSHNYGDGKILKDISMMIDKGEFIAIIGKSGSGKSTFLNIIGGLLEPSEGKVIINNVDIYSLKENEKKRVLRNNISYIFQDYLLVDEFTLYENIQLPFLIKDEEIDMSYLNELLKMMDLENKLNKLPSQLSGGEKQRVAALRAILQKPNILLCDEPTGNLDEKNTKILIDILKKCHDQYQQCILLVTHDMDIARSADRIIRIQDGVINFDKSGDFNV